MGFRGFGLRVEPSTCISWFLVGVEWMFRTSLQKSQERVFFNPNFES